MIKLTRSAKPAVIETNQVAWTAALLNARTKKQKKDAEGKYNHHQIKDALIIMCNDKCSYCESIITHVDFGNIEHFKPKSKRPDLAFDWDNLFLSCTMCNSTRYKGDKFPEAAEGGPIINPCDDDPNDHFEFFFDMTAKISTLNHRTPRGEVTKNLLGLNRPKLRAVRSAAMRKIAALVRLAEADGEARELVEAACQDDAEFSAFAAALRADIAKIP